MKSRMSGLLLLVGLLTVSGCQSSDPVSLDPTPVRNPTNLEKQLVEADNIFGIKLFKAIADNQPDSNIFISPLSVSLALGMTPNGASGTTYAEMKSTLEMQGLTEQEINESFRSLIDLLTDLDPQIIFKIANSVWTDKGFPVRPEFLDINQTYFDAESRELDLQLPEALEIINTWIADNTNNRIINALDQIPPNTRMYLINAIYFKGFWTYQFDPKDTYDSQFRNHDDTQTGCQMMALTSDLGYFETDIFQAVDLPYGNQRFSMTILLPKSEYTTDDVLYKLTTETWQQWTNSFQMAAISISLPRFKLEYDIELKNILTTLGMGSAFSAGANFSYICAERDLFINRVIHKTFIEVDEEGTEAAAVTIVEMNESSTGSFMIMNRPFIFALRDQITNTLLFLGVINEFPTE